MKNEPHEHSDFVRFVAVLAKSKARYAISRVGVVYVVNVGTLQVGFDGCGDLAPGIEPVCEMPKRLVDGALWTHIIDANGKRDTFRAPVPMESAS